MSSMGIEPLAFPQLPGTPTIGDTGAALGVDGPQGPEGPQGASGDFGHLLVNSLDQLEGMGDKASDLSVQAATGDLNAIHDYTIAATEAQVATQLTVAVRNKAVDAFNEIMRMSV